ncbi:antitoxin Xre/MbcA/ParS toxin-binding domain-containing protein [Pseudoalteromonas sp. SWN166]
MLFHSKIQADTWVRRPNKAFENLSALEFMLKDNKENIDHVYRYLRAQLF